MSFEQAIIERWAADAELNGLLPSARVFNGSAAGSPNRPYVVLQRQGNKPAVRASGGRRVDALVLRFNIWSDSLDEGKTLLAAISRLYERSSFEAEGLHCLNMQEANQQESLEENGVWRLFADYAAVNQINSEA
jgi:hypothetical protein